MYKVIFKLTLKVYPIRIYTINTIYYNMPKVMLEGYRCERCGHQWLPRSTTEGDPTICPKCKSPYWNKPRINSSKRTKSLEDRVKEEVARE